MESIITIGIFIAGVLAGCFLGLKLKTGGNVSRGKYDGLVQEKTALATKLEAANADKQSLNETLEKTRRELTETRERIVVSDHRLAEQRQELEKMREQLRLEFRHTANTIFEDMSAKFSTQSEKKIGDLLNPLQLHLNDFKKLVGDSFSEQGKEQRSLQGEIKRIVEMNESMRLQTDSLTRALRGDVKAQGNWGEVMLERILEESGLRRGEDYTIQGIDMGLTDDEGGRQQPDVIVKLPDNKQIIIDAKVSLVAYERYCGETDETARAVHCREFLKSVKAHINGLEQKRYQHNEKLLTPDFVLMFMPIEGAYSFALQQDRELHAYAWGKKIVLVCPATLFASLRTIASLWNIERQNRNSQEIARQGGALYDKFAGFLEDMENISKHMGKLRDSYDAAMNKLSTGRGNLIGQAEKLKELGVKSAKSLKAAKGEELLELESAMVES